MNEYATIFIIIGFFKLMVSTIGITILACKFKDIVQWIKE